MLIEKIKQDLQNAIKNQNQLVVSVLRLLIAEVQNKQIAQGSKKDELIKDDDLIKVLRSQVKQRQESIEAYRQAKRDELISKESQELDILSKYLPQEMDPNEVKKIVQQVIDDVKPSGPQDFGKIMSEAMKRLAGRVDGSQVSGLVKEMI